MNFLGTTLLPKVSVIVTSFNRAEVLRVALRSVMEQTWQDFELIVVEDGSTDHSLDVIGEYCRKYPQKVRLCRHKNGKNCGIVASYQLAISKAGGEFVAFLEHDDFWPPDFLEKKVSILSEEPNLSVVFSPYKIVTRGWFARDMILRQFLLRRFFPKNAPFENFSNLLQCNNVATFSSFMTRTALLKKIRFPPRHMIALDWWILLNLSLDGPFYCDDSCYVNWRWSKSSTVGSQTYEEHKNNGLEFMTWMYAELEGRTADLSSEKRLIFERFAKKFVVFKSFYLNPTPKKFFWFFMDTPVWSSASLASLFLNHMKFKSKRHG